MQPLSIHVDAPRPHEVLVGAGLLGELAARVAAFSQSVVLTDENVARLYRNRLPPALADACIVVPPGEASKSFGALERVLDALAEARLDRRACLVCLGGGTVGDLGGLAAALYMRGIAHVQVPTTLLAQVDASVGGKNAVNLRAGKNLAGTFHAPALVLADVATLATLGDEDFASGLGEVVKSALIAGEDALAALERGPAAVLRREPARMTAIVADCVRTKAAIVARDPFEAGERKQLNLGHTFAHAIEHAAGFGAVPHGVAVAVGLALALRASRALGLLADTALPERIERLLTAFGLPASLDALRARTGSALEPARIASAMRMDKKGEAGAVRLVLPERAGRLRCDVAADERFLAQILAG